jgi:MFS family permease
MHTTIPAPRLFFGWKVVAAAFAVAVFAWGLGFYGPSIYVNQLVRTKGWPISLVSGAVTVHFLFSALLVLGLDEAHRRLGITTVTRVGVIAFGLGAMGFAHAQEIWHLYVAALFTGTGWAVLSGAAINAFVAPWFAKKRAVALSHAYNGASFGGVLMTPLWTSLIAAFGFETASIVIAVGGLLILWPLAGFVLAQTPARQGVRPDGALPTLPTFFPPMTEQPPRTRAQLMADRRFSSLSIAFAIGIFAQMGLITHLIVRLTPDLGATLAALCLSLATVCAIVGRFTLAWFVGERRRRLAGAVNFLIQATGVGLLVIGTTAEMLIGGCVLVGLGVGNLLSLPPLILQSEQRPADIGRALALLTAINQVVFAFAPGAFGLLRDATGSYTSPFLLAAVAQVVAAGIVVWGGWGLKTAHSNLNDTSIAHAGEAGMFDWWWRWWATRYQRDEIQKAVAAIGGSANDLVQTARVQDAISKFEVYDGKSMFWQWWRIRFGRRIAILVTLGVMCTIASVLDIGAWISQLTSPRLDAIKSLVLAFILLESRNLAGGFATDRWIEARTEAENRRSQIFVEIARACTSEKPEDQLQRTRNGFILVEGAHAQDQLSYFSNKIAQTKVESAPSSSTWSNVWFILLCLALVVLALSQIVMSFDIQSEPWRSIGHAISTTFDAQFASLAVLVVGSLATRIREFDARRFHLRHSSLFATAEMKLRAVVDGPEFAACKARAQQGETGQLDTYVAGIDRVLMDVHSDWSSGVSSK